MLAAAFAARAGRRAAGGDVTLRRSLLRLTLAVLLPALLFMAILTVLLVREQRAAVRAGLSQTASALSAAVDAHVIDALNALRVLASNAELQSGDLAQFRQEATRVATSLAAWDHVILADATGKQLFNTLAADTGPLPPVGELPPIRAVVATGEAYVGGALFDDGTTGHAHVAVALPLLRDGRVAYVLAAILDPAAMSKAFAHQELGNGWAATVFDTGHKIVAQSSGAEIMFGSWATPARIAGIVVGDAGRFESPDREEVRSIGAFQRSDLTGWTVMLAAPHGALLASVSRSILLVLGGGLLFVVFGAVLSTRMGQGIERSMRSLVVPARRLASGQKLLPRPKARLQEIELIGEEMDRAAELLEQRAQQQDAIGRLALQAVTAVDREDFFDEALKVVTGTLQVDFCDVLEHLPTEDAFVLRAGIGWKPGMVGTQRIANDPGTLAGHVWARGELVVYRDLVSETRFTQIALLQELGAVTGMAVLILGPQQPFGVLGIHSALYREFTDADFDFARAVANVVSAFLSRTEAERQQVESERLLRHFVASMNAVPYRYDVDAGRYTFVGPQSMRLLGFTPEEWGTVGWWARQMHPDDRRIALEQEEMLTARGEDYVLEYRMVTNDGRTVWIRDIVRVEIAENGHKMLYGMAIDITAAKEHEQQLLEAQKLQAIGQLTGGVAHDFNNLLAIIVGTCELLTEQAAGSPTLQKTVGQIASAADRGAALTQRLLAFSRKQALKPDIVDMNELVREMEPLLGRTLGENVAIRARLAQDLGATLADRGQLENVLVNLALNARDAMPDGGDVVVETQNVSFDAQNGAGDNELRPGYYVMLAVSDTGTGMTPEVKARAFEPFFTTKNAGRGSGLGLSTVYGFIKQSGGNTVIRSEPGRGTTVRVYLPRVEPCETDTTADAVADAPGCNETVLVVEDDTTVRNVVAGMVESLGYQVLESESGTDAIALLESGERVDLVLSDVVMPGQIDGWKLAQAVWERWPATRVLLTTGYSDNVLVRHATLDRRTQVISKPYRRSELSQKLREVLAT